MSLAAFIAAGVGAWARKGAAALGLGLVSYVGFAALEGQISSAVLGALSGVPADVYQILALGGFMTVVNIWLAAITMAVSLLTFKRLGVLA